MLSNHDVIILHFLFHLWFYREPECRWINRNYPFNMSTGRKHDKLSKHIFIILHFPQLSMKFSFEVQNYHLHIQPLLVVLDYKGAYKCTMFNGDDSCRFTSLPGGVAWDPGVKLTMEYSWWLTIQKKLQTVADQKAKTWEDVVQKANL